MKNRIKLLLIGFIFLISAFFAVSETQAATGTCNWTWPQKVVIDGATYSCGSGKNYCNYDKAQQGIGECCENYGPYRNCVTVVPTEVVTDFQIDAWGYPGYYAWGACVNQTATREQLDAFCKSRGYTGIISQTDACFHYGEANRWAWDGKIPMVKGNYTRAGYALTKVKCAKDASSQPVGPSCSDTDGGEIKNIKGTVVAKGDSFTDSCSDSTTLLEGVCSGDYFIQKSISCPAGCSDGACNICTENWSCGAWSACVSSNQTRTCTDTNNCGTTANKPETSQSCYTGEVVEVNTDFSIDAWGYRDWGSCDTYQTGTKAELDAFCKSKGHMGIFSTDPCYHAIDVLDRWTWDGKIPMVKGNYTKGGYALTKVKCVKTPCTEIWSCGGWSSCTNSQQTRTCTDSNSCGTTANKPSVTQSCACQESWSCADWSVCQNNQQTRTCADANSCGTASSKPATSQSCTCTENWSCADWSSCVNDRQTRTCSDSNNCGTISFKPQIEKNCAAQTCAENWTCGEWSGCLNNKQARACVDSGKCGTSKNKPATEQNCVCVEKWICGDWTVCQNGQQTKTCTDLNNCGTAKNKPLIKQNCQVQPEPKQPSPTPQPVPPSTETTSAAPLKTEAYIKDTKITIEKKQEGVFTIVSGDTAMTTSLEVVSSSSKPYLKTSQGLKEIKNSPEEIKAKVADKVNVINKIEIKEQNKKPLFSVSGVKKAKLLFLFPVSAKMEFQIDLEKGEIISIKKPWWSFLAKF